MAGTDEMCAWAVTEPGPIDGEPLAMVSRPVPTPGEDELLVRVRACGVCRTDTLVREPVEAHRHRADGSRMPDRSVLDGT